MQAPAGSETLSKRPNDTRVRGAGPARKPLLCPKACKAPHPLQPIVRPRAEHLPRWIGRPLSGQGMPASGYPLISSVYWSSSTARRIASSSLASRSGSDSLERRTSIASALCPSEATAAQRILPTRPMVISPSPSTSQSIWGHWFRGRSFDFIVSRCSVRTVRRVRAASDRGVQEVWCDGSPPEDGSKLNTRQPWEDHLRLPRCLFQRPNDTRVRGAGPRASLSSGRKHARPRIPCSRLLGRTRAGGRTAVQERPYSIADSSSGVRPAKSGVPRN